MKILHAGVATAALAIAALPLPAVAQDGQTGPSPAVMQYRESMFDEAIRPLANRTMALMFNTAPVEAGDSPLELPVRSAPLDFTYEANGEIHQASDVIENTFVDGLLIIKHGTIVYEGNFNRSTAESRYNSYSMAKSLNAIMVGLAVKEGLIGSVTDQVTQYLPELNGTGYDGATIRDLMEMRSGIAWDENFFSPGTPSYDAHVASWVQERTRYTDAALITEREHEPGTFNRYNSLDAAVAGWVVERAAGMPVSEYLSTRLWKPAGMQADAFYVIDGEPGVGREFTAGGFNAVLRDYGRLGLLMLNDGHAKGTPFFPDGFVANLRRDITEGSAGDGLGYGWFWWTVNGTEAFTALGGEGQYIYVDPETETVIVKMSHGPVGPAADPVGAEELAFLKAASRWDGR
ncbi:class C beta-lactamase-related serine hydrolase [Aurantiacibacter xanthus]|uniref:Class C beta-lactamase-related serine hydrolase n=1 Tax=Aurantiacibacter xanthus TaxID=1784712 RepID=A0A3A1P035_9SPHN|nr:serine hydrolase [Aurantiacibacter xanthus]RIV80059.1 class C beta-lactamase-related serine hydrolase [Aurantiacibacter xanthus]